MKLKLLQTLSLFAVLIAGGILLSGCASDDGAGNVSERPWNDTTGWQGGLPSGLNEGR